MLTQAAARCRLTGSDPVDAQQPLLVPTRPAAELSGVLADRARRSSRASSPLLRGRRVAPRARPVGAGRTTWEAIGRLGGSGAGSEGGEQLDVVPFGERSHSRVEGDQTHAPAAGERQQVGVGHLAVAGQPRHVGVADRHVVDQEAVTVRGAQSDRTARAGSTPMGLGTTFGLDDTRTNPLSVIGHVAQPPALLAANHVRIAA